MSKRGRVIPAERLCAVCGKSRDPWTPMDHFWDVHVAELGLVETCSPVCREKAGYAERKQVRS